MRQSCRDADVKDQSMGSKSSQDADVDRLSRSCLQAKSGAVSIREPLRSGRVISPRALLHLERAWDPCTKIDHQTEWAARRADRYSTRDTSREEGSAEGLLVRRLSIVAFDIAGPSRGAHGCCRYRRIELVRTSCS